jgi:hypothetical protein
MIRWLNFLTGVVNPPHRDHLSIRTGSNKHQQERKRQKAATAKTVRTHSAHIVTKFHLGSGPSVHVIDFVNASMRIVARALHS